MFKKLKKFSSYSIKAIAASVFAYSSASKIASFTKNKYDDIYDLAIIGGGSGGLATAFEAANHGLKTIVIDYV
jgi:ribulose 1,5-bisphosphate synthetase/thiazole synthase